MAETPRECPFCGGVATVRRTSLGEAVVRCEGSRGDGCVVRPEVRRPNEASAIAAWNRRAEPVQGERDTLWDAAREFLKLVADFERHTGHMLPRDHACVECVPNSDILVDGFRCGYHTLKALTREPPDGGGEPVRGEEHGAIPPGKSVERVVLEALWEADMGDADAAGSYERTARIVAAALTREPSRCPDGGGEPTEWDRGYAQCMHEFSIPGPDGNIPGDQRRATPESQEEADAELDRVEVARTVRRVRRGRRMYTLAELEAAYGKAYPDSQGGVSETEPLSEYDDGFRRGLAVARERLAVPPEPTQEPVAWRWRYVFDGEPDRTWNHVASEDGVPRVTDPRLTTKMEAQALYASPPVAQEEIRRAVIHGYLAAVNDATAFDHPARESAAQEADLYLSHYTGPVAQEGIANLLFRLAWAIGEDLPADVVAELKDEAIAAVKRLRSPHGATEPTGGDTKIDSEIDLADLKEDQAHRIRAWLPRGSARRLDVAGETAQPEECQPGEDRRMKDVRVVRANCGLDPDLSLLGERYTGREYLALLWPEGVPAPFDTAEAALKEWMWRKERVRIVLPPSREGGDLWWTVMEKSDGERTWVATEDLRPVEPTCCTHPVKTLRDRRKGERRVGLTDRRGLQPYSYHPVDRRGNDGRRDTPGRRRRP